MARRYRSGGYSPRYRSPSRSYGYSDVGRERALQHIRDAERLTAELGGTDKDVKAYFFSLPASQLARILDEYEQRHGSSAREYAEATLPSWKIGRVKMSGTVAERLFALLPPRMPMAAKYGLTESLWKHVGPRSKKRLRVGAEVGFLEIVTAVKEHIDDVVTAYHVPSSLEARFNWLSAGDVRVKQDLLSHLQQLEKSHVVEAARVQVPVMLDHMRSSASANTHRLAQTLKVGNHELEILVDADCQGVSLEEWTPPRSGKLLKRGASDAAFWFWFVMALIGIYFLTRHR